MIEGKEHIIFLGIGGIGMSALARYLNDSTDAHIQGYDKTPSPLTDELRREGISVTFTDSFTSLKKNAQVDASNTLVIYTPAIPDDLKLFAHFEAHGFDCVKRSKALGMITKGTTNISVAGTHGKTTTSSMLAHLLRVAGTEHVALLGGISSELNSNYFNNSQGSDKIISVTEADEYDRSFLQLHPAFAAITSIDPDHLDIYGDGEQLKESFVDFAQQVDTLFVHHSLTDQFGSVAYKGAYGIDHGDYYAQNVRVENASYHFDLQTPTGSIKDIRLGIPGRHNVENAVAASALYLESGGKPEYIHNALANFRGVKRRFEYILREPIVHIDDYAHHPSELSATIGSVRELYKDRTITGIFQPHLYSRTKDFYLGFAESLSLLDEIILLDIYPAREKPIPGVTSRMIAKEIPGKDVKVLAKDELLPYLSSLRPEVLLTLGAGDIDRFVEPIKALFE